jgi:hypothetical protein
VSEASVISWRAILRGAATRFAAGIGSFLAGSFVLAAAVKGIEIGPAQILGFTELTVALTAGYMIALGLLRPALQSEAGVEGRRSVVAGLGATCVYHYMTVLHVGPSSHLLRDVMALSAGGLTTLCVFLPWLSNRLDRKDIEARENLLREMESLSEQLNTPTYKASPAFVERDR